MKTVAVVDIAAGELDVEDVGVKNIGQPSVVPVDGHDFGKLGIVFRYAPVEQFSAGADFTVAIIGVIGIAVDDVRMQMRVGNLRITVVHKGIGQKVLARHPRPDDQAAKYIGALRQPQPVYGRNADHLWIEDTRRVCPSL